MSLQTGFTLVNQRELNEHKRYEMYMANVKILRWGLNATYIPLSLDFLSVAKLTNQSKSILTSPVSRGSHTIILKEYFLMSKTFKGLMGVQL